MAITVDKELTLGVLFRGRVDASFMQATRRLRTALGSVTKATTSSTKATKKTSAPTKKASDEFSMLGKRISGVAGGFQRLTNAMKVTASYGIAAAAIFGVINALRKGTEAIFDFDQALKNLQAITGATDAEIGALGERIKYVAATTKFSAQEVADAAILLGQAGFSAAESLEAIESVAFLATGTLSDMRNVADLMTTAVRAFGMEAAQSAEIADIFAVAVNKSKLTIDKLRIAFNYLGPIAKQADMTLRETAAGTMILANAGFRGSTIGTGLRQVLARLVAPSEKLKTVFKAAGADLEKLNPATNDFKDVMAELSKVLGASIPKAERARRAFVLFGLRGSATASALAQAGEEGFGEIYDWLGRVGAASDMAEKQMEGLGVMAKNLRDKLGILAVGIGEGGIAGAFRVLLSVVRPLVDVLIYLANTLTGKVMVAWAALTVVILTGRIAIKYMLVQLSALSFGYSVATVKMMVAAQMQNTLTVAWTAGTVAIKKLYVAMWAHPFVAIIAGISLAIVGLVAWRRHSIQSRQELAAHAIQIQSTIGALERYEKRLQETTDSEKEHSALIERLVKEYPELALSVDLVTMKWKDEGKALAELIRVKKTMYLEDKIELAALHAKEAKYHAMRLKMWGAEREAFDLGLPTVEKSQKDFELRTRMGTKAQGEFDLAIRDSAETLKFFGITARSTSDEILTVLSEKLGKSREELKRFAEAIAKYFADSLKAQKPEKQADVITKQINMIDGLGEEWRIFYDSLDERRKIDLLLAIDTAQKKIESFRKIAEEALIGPEQIKYMEKVYMDDVLRTFIATEDKKITKKREFFEKLRRMALKYEDDTQAYDEAKARDVYEKQLRAAKVFFTKREMTEKEYDEAKILAEEALQEQLASIQDKYDEKYLKDRLKTIEDEYKRKEITVEYYLEFLDEARRQDLIKEEEYTKKKIELTGSWLDNLRYGLRRASEEAQTFGDMWQEIGGEIIDKIGTGFADAIWDIGERTKTAKEAFEDFAKSTLSWISKMILRLITMRMLMSIFAPTPTPGVGMPGTAVAHSGARIGKDMLSYISRNISPDTFAFAPRFHGGLRADEFPAILQSGETVLPRGVSPVNIEVVNNTSAETHVFEDEQFGEKFVKIIVGKVAEDINKGGPTGMAVLSQVGSGMKKNMAIRDIFRRTL